VRSFIASAYIAASLSALAPAAAQTPAPAPTPAPIAPLHVVTYLEFSDDHVGQGVAVLTEYRAKSLRQPGNANFEIFQEIGYPFRFVALETWETSTAYETHAKSTAAPKVPWMTAPADVRLHKRWNAAGALAPTNKSVYAITHVDVPPPRLAETEAIMKTLVEKSRAEPGVLRFEIWQSTTRSNHFTFVEGWESAEAAQAHAMAAHTREFREKLNPLLGALYDQRYFKVLP
jgi:quinol monooxygenase YgiN